MSDQTISVVAIPKPADRNSINKPVFLLLVENPDSKLKLAYYKAQSIVKNANSVEIRGCELTKAQADKIREQSNVTTEAEREINIEIPWQRIIRIENLSYKKQAQGENK